MVDCSAKSAPSSAAPASVIKNRDIPRPRSASGTTVCITMFEQAMGSIMRQNPTGTSSIVESQRCVDPANRVKPVPNPAEVSAIKIPRPLRGGTNARVRGGNTFVPPGRCRRSLCEFRARAARLFSAPFVKALAPLWRSREGEFVREQIDRGSSALPGKNTAFLRRALAMSLTDRISASPREGWVFFDRGLMDAAVGLQHLTGEKALASLGPTRRFHQRVFLTPPWPEIYLTEPGAASWIGLRCYRAIGDSSRFTVAWL